MPEVEEKNNSKKKKNKSLDLAKYKEIFKRYAKKILLVILLLALVTWLVYFLVGKFYKPAPESRYSVAVVIKDKSDLKYGDVLLYKEGENRVWSSTEKLSYLILDMSLTKEESQKLTENVSRQFTKEEIEKELAEFRSQGEERDLSQEEIDRYRDELENRQVEIAPRKYRVDMESEFKGFKPNDLIKGQPYSEEVYDWKIMEKRK